MQQEFRVYFVLWSCYNNPSERLEILSNIIIMKINKSLYIPCTSDKQCCFTGHTDWKAAFQRIWRSWWTKSQP